MQVVYQESPQPDVLEMSTSRTDECRQRLSLTRNEAYVGTNRDSWMTSKKAARWGQEVSPEKSRNDDAMLKVMVGWVEVENGRMDVLPLPASQTNRAWARFADESPEGSHSTESVAAGYRPKVCPGSCSISTCERGHVYGSLWRCPPLCLRTRRLMYRKSRFNRLYCDPREFEARRMNTPNSLSSPNSTSSSTNARC